MKRLITILIIATVHFALAVAAALSTFNLSGVFFGVYPPPNDGLLHRIIAVAHDVLMFPLGRAAESLGSGAGILAWPLVVLNSLVWALVIYNVAKRLSRLTRHRAIGMTNEV